jgi:hypothetical protein
MEAIAEILAAIAVFVVEITFHSLVFAFLLCRSVVSPRYREQMRSEWRRSLGHRFAIVTGITLYTAMFVVAAAFWIPTIFYGSDRSRTPSFIESPAKSEPDSTPSAKKKVIRVIGDYVKKKLQEKSDRAEQSSESKSTR